MLICVFLTFALFGFGTATTGSECGVITAQTDPTAVKAEDVPWHVAVYQKTSTANRQICGGTLVSATIVISAAHCFWSYKNVPEPAAQYAVAVGKLYRTWDEPEDTHAQTSDVAEISIPLRFRGNATNYQDDISVLRLATPIQFNSFVRPACFDFDPQFESIQLTSGKLGKIASWSILDAGSETGGQRRPLEVQDVPYVSLEQCLGEVPAAFRGYISSDKLCAYAKDSSQVLCRGGSGGGLTFPAQERGATRHYLRGVASTSVLEDDSSCSHYTAFTQISKHEDFIKKHFKQ